MRPNAVLSPQTMYRGRRLNDTSHHRTPIYAYHDQYSFANNPLVPALLDSVASSPSPAERHSQCIGDAENRIGIVGCPPNKPQRAGLMHALKMESRNISLSFILLPGEDEGKSVEQAVQ
ncbi:hypothetical protein B0H19DRAFT_1083494 [Mycena capillaripes]|nr:hypothetical protein B0H19DRAFT_1083494 [Mycena capillaripes]